MRLASCALATAETMASLKTPSTPDWIAVARRGKRRHRSFGINSKSKLAAAGSLVKAGL